MERRHTIAAVARFTSVAFLFLWRAYISLAGEGAGIVYAVHTIREHWSQAPRPPRAELRFMVGEYSALDQRLPSPRNLTKSTICDGALVLPKIWLSSIN